MTATHPVESLLLELGDTPDAIAKALEAHSIKGVRESACACALAVYLRQHGHEVKVHPLSISMGDGWWHMPLPLVEFIEHFDNGRYPALVLA